MSAGNGYTQPVPRLRRFQTATAIQRWGDATSYLDRLVTAYSAALAAETPHAYHGSLADGRSALATAHTASDRGRALATIAHALVRESDTPALPLCAGPKN